MKCCIAYDHEKTQQHYFFDGTPLNVIFMLRAYSKSRYSKG
jgi:hypothetical protein